MSQLRRMVVAALLIGTVAAPSAQAAGTVRSAITLSAPASGEYGSTIKLSGRLWRYGTPYGIQGALVWLQRAPHGRTSWANITNTRTGANGTYGFDVIQAGAYDYRTVYTGSATYTIATSPTRYPVTTQKVPLDSIVTTDEYTGAMRVAGRVLPTPPNGTTVYLQRWDSAAQAWHTIEAGRTTGGGFGIAVNRPASVTAYRVVVAARSPYGIGISPARWFANYVWRGAFARPVSSNPPNHYAVPTAADNPRREEITVVVGNTPTTTVNIDTRGCKRIVTYTIAPPFDFTPVQLSLRTTRVLAEATLEPRRTATMTGEVLPAEQVVGFRHVSPDTQRAFDSTVLVLCTN